MVGMVKDRFAMREMKEKWQQGPKSLSDYSTLCSLCGKFCYLCQFDTDDQFYVHGYDLHTRSGSKSADWSGLYLCTRQWPWPCEESKEASGLQYQSQYGYTTGGWLAGLADYTRCQRNMWLSRGWHILNKFMNF